MAKSYGELYIKVPRGQEKINKMLLSMTHEKLMLEKPSIGLKWAEGQVGRGGLGWGDGGGAGGAGAGAGEGRGREISRGLSGCHTQFATTTG